MKSTFGDNFKFSYFNEGKIEWKTGDEISSPLGKLARSYLQSTALKSFLDGQNTSVEYSETNRIEYNLEKSARLKRL